MQVQGFVVGSPSTTSSAGTRSAFYRPTAVPESVLNARQRQSPQYSQTRLSNLRHGTSSACAAGTSDRSPDGPSGTRQPASGARSRAAQPFPSKLVPTEGPEEPSSSKFAEGSSPQGSFLQQQYPTVSEGRRSSSWEYKQGADKRSLWGIFVKGVALVVLGTAAGTSKLKTFLVSAGQVLTELTYPKPGAILRLTCAVLLSSAALTLLVWGLDKGFSSALLPHVARKLSGIS